jgi:hypothetical protein
MQVGDMVKLHSLGTNLDHSYGELESYIEDIKCWRVKVLDRDAVLNVPSNHLTFVKEQVARSL